MAFTAGPAFYTHTHCTFCLNWASCNPWLSKSEIQKPFRLRSFPFPLGQEIQQLKSHFASQQLGLIFCTVVIVQLSQLCLKGPFFQPKKGTFTSALYILAMHSPQRTDTDTGFWLLQSTAGIRALQVLCLSKKGWERSATRGRHWSTILSLPKSL